MLGYLRMAPWRRGPVLLLLRPGVFIALVAACFVATLPAAAAGPFVSASRHATLRDQIAQSCRSFVGDWVTDPVPSPPVRSDFSSASDFQAAVDARSDSITAATRARASANAAAAGLHPLLTTQVMNAYLSDSAPINVVDRTGFERNVTVLSGPRGSGLWIPDGYAQDAHLAVGSVLTFTAANGMVVGRLPVAAVYRDLRSEPQRPYWCGLSSLWNAQTGFNQQPPPFVLADDTTFAKTLAAGRPDPLGRPSHVDYLEWSLPNDAPSIATAKQALASIGHINALLGVSHRLPVPGQPAVSYYTSDLRDFLLRADLAGDTMRPAIAPITAAGIGVGLAIVAAAGVFWVLRRRQELAVLSAHGMSARSLGVKATLESLPALTIGAVAGWAFAVFLVRTAGPSSILARNSIIESIEAAAATFIGSVIVVGAVAAMRARSLADHRGVRRLAAIGLVPWEILLVVGAPFVWRWLGGSVVTSGNTAGQTAGIVVHVPVRLLIVPVLAIVGVLALAGRIWATALRRRRTGKGRTIPRYLAGRRLVREAAVAVVLAMAAAVPVSLAVYGAAITNSVQTTLDAKARLYAGSDVVLTLQKPAPIPAVFAGHATTVIRLNGVLVNGVSTDLLGVDPATFARGAFWNDEITGQSLTGIVKPLQPSGTFNAPTVVAAGTTRTGPQQINLEGRGPTSVDVESIATLPAQHSGYPAALIDQSLVAKASSGLFQLWIRGDPQAILDQVASTGLRTKYVQTASAVTVNSIYEPLTFTFEYLTALSLLCGVIAVVGLLLYLEARTPGHRRAFVMLHRMGMGTPSHWRAILWELGTPLIVGLVTGLGASVIAAYALRHKFDINPTLPPGGLLTLPAGAMVAIAGAVIVVTVVASGYAQARVVRTNPSEILRDAG